jgi:hypothetical protein
MDIEELSARLSVADISTAVAFGLQRALERQQSQFGDIFADKILRYGGRIYFDIEVLPANMKTPMQDVLSSQSE